MRVPFPSVRARVVTDAGATSPAEPAPWEIPLAEAFERVDSGPEGLAEAEAAARLARYGPNRVASGRRWSAVGEVVSYLTNPLILLLLAAAGLSAALGETTNAVIVGSMVLGSVGLNVVQGRQSTRAADRLRRSVASRANVLRDGAWRSVLVEDVVPGDVVRLSGGDLVPADVRLVAANALVVEESALTGESAPVDKAVGDHTGPPRPAAEAANFVFLGTHVSAGSGDGLVMRTGRATEFGRVAAHLAARPPDTDFERGSRGFAVLIMRTVIVLAAFVLAVNLVARRDPVESLLFAVALAVGLTPEYLPMITTVALARGAIRMSRGKVVVRRLAAIENFGSIEILCSDKTGTLTEGQMAVARVLDADGEDDPDGLALHLAALNSHYQLGLRSAFDDAILRAAPADPRATAVDEVPFDFERRRLSVIVTVGGQGTLVTKGAPESVLAVCSGRPTLPAAVASLGEQGLRVLAVASRPIGVQPDYTIGDERDLALAGFLAFADPLRPGIAAVIEEMRADGIRLKVLTGDAPQVAVAVCAGVGLDVTRVVTGPELEGLTLAEVGALAEQVDVFARVSPEQKNDIIAALKEVGRVVGYLGDGINDAPSLRTADVGISVANAVDVAREAADIILVEPGLEALHRGVIEGRRSFGNIMKYVMMGTSSNFGNMFSMAGASLFLPFLPMLPTQLLVNNFLYDVSQLTLPADAVDEGDLRRPRHWEVTFIRRFMLTMGPVSSVFDFVTFGAMLWLFDAPAGLFRTGWFVESLATQTLVIFVIRTSGNPLRSRPSPWLVLSVAFAVGVGGVLPFTPLAGPLQFERPPLDFFLFLVAVVVVYLGLAQAVKAWFYRRYAPGSA